jgi:prolipoprotein diacylglyceryl transferase
VPHLAAIPPPPFSGFQLGPLDVRMYGLLIALGAYLALRWATRRYERFGGDPEVAERVALWVLAAGFLGARIGYVIPRFDRFLDDPLSILYIWEGGLALFGGLFAGTVVGAVLIRRLGGDTPAFADAVAPAVPLAQAIGRWGNYFNQELYGRPTDLPWAVRIEGGDPRYPGVETFHPTFLYESLGNLVLVAVLLASSGPAVSDAGAAVAVRHRVRAAARRRRVAAGRHRRALLRPVAQQLDRHRHRPRRDRRTALVAAARSAAR